MLSNSDRNDRLNEDLLKAAERGDAAQVQALLRGNGVPCGAISSDALITAAQIGHTQVVLALLRDRRSDPTAQDCLALAWASTRGHAEIVRALLQDGRADPAALGGRALRCAVQFGRTEVVRLLLKDGRCDPAVNNHPYTFADPVNGRYVDVLCLILAAMNARAVQALITQSLRRKDTPESVAALLRACATNPVIPRMLAVLRALIKTDLPAQTILSLASEAARRNIGSRAVLHLYGQGQLARALDGMLGSNAAMPPIEAIERHVELRAFASVSKAEPVLQVGHVLLEPGHYPGIIAALAPTLPAHVASAVWQMLRAQARGEEPERAYGTPAERVRDRIASNVLLTSLAREYNAFAADVKAVADEKQPLLSAAANRCLLGLNALSSAVERKDIGSVAKAQAELQDLIDPYEELMKASREAQHDKHAHRFALLRSIIDMRAEDVASLAPAQAREKSRNPHTLDL